MAHPLSRALFDAAHFEAQIENLHDKYRVGGADIMLKQQGVELASIMMESKSFARAIVKDLKADKYRIQPAKLIEIEVGGKKRIIYQFRLSDLIVHGVVSHLVHEACMPKFSPNLHSYIKGRNWWEAIQSFSACARDYQASVADKRKRGLYVLRRDVSSYTDSIPVGATSPLWPLLRRETKFPDNPKGADLTAWKIIESVIRTEAYTLVGAGHFTNLIGVATGSPISTTLFNVYLVELDRAVDALAPLFYARYGDDLIVADPDPAKAQKIARTIAEVLAEHELQSNAKKSSDLYFNAAARGSSEWIGARGADKVTFLGCDIGANGTTRLSTKAKRSLLDDLQKRLKNLQHHVQPESSSLDRMKTACRALNSGLAFEDRLAHKSAPLLRHVITDRPSLKELDRLIALMALKFATGSSSVKAFRQISYRTLRSKGQLLSLFHRRNLVGKRR